MRLPTSISELLAAVGTFIHIITGKAQRTERFDYPEDAIREIVINMIVHRDYRDVVKASLKSLTTE
jgi:predicted HTH transcriptional regulator